MPANMTVSLRFVRPEFAFGPKGTVADKDDVATIKPMEGGQYTLDYLYRNSTQRLRSKQTLDASSLFRWASTTMGLLELDSEPFAALQLTMDGFPSAFIAVDQLRANHNRGYHAVMDALEFFVNYTQGPQRAMPSTLSDSKFSAYLLKTMSDNTDDLISVQAAPNGEYVVTNKEDMDNRKGHASRLVLDRAGVEQWLRLILNFLRVDGDPHEALQLSMSGFPDILLPISTVTEDSRIQHKIDASKDRILDALDFFLDNTEAPEENFIPVPRMTTKAALSAVAEVGVDDEETVSTEEEEEDDDEETVSTEEEEAEEDDLSSEAYSTDSEDEYADMPALVPASQHVMDEYAAYRYSTWAPKSQHLFFDSDGDVIMGH